MRIVSVACAGVLAIVVVLAAGDDAPAAKAPTLDAFKALAGEWIRVDAQGKPTGGPGVSYRVTAGGSAVLETIFPGTPHEMLTLYHRDGSDLVLTHYCVLGNQPRMRCKAADGNTLRFAFDGGTNVDPAKDAHMHDATFTFVDADTLVSVWSMYDGGKETERTEFRYARKK